MGKKITVVLMVLFLVLGGLACSAAGNEETKSKEQDSDERILQELDGKRFGVQTGSTFDKDVLSWFPNAQLFYYNSLPDMVVALETGKIDAFPSDAIVLEMMNTQNESDSIRVLKPFMDEYSCGFVFDKTPEGGQLRDLFDEWMSSAEASGQLKQMMDKWLHAAEEDKTMPDYKALPADKRTLIFATEAGFPPFDYVRSGEVVGFEVEMAIEFCKAYGYGIEIMPMSFEGILPAVQSGKVDFAASGIAITEERKESINFSRPYYTGGTRIVVPGTVSAGKKTFIARTIDSFEKTFLREDRWKMFVEGSVNTLVITVFSILFGTLLGFLVFLLCRSRGAIVNGVTSWFTWLLQGMPVVVLLMILYYIVFGKTSLEGMVISIIGFTLVFGVSVLGILRTGVSAVDNGQTEAACALGCTPRQAFYHIILPQALPFMTDPYKGEIIGLVKATSIVGYIAVLDLTKMGDLVRSRTYEAFFPLIAVMVIYFILEGILGLCVGIIAKKISPRKKNNGKLLKGVNRHD